LCSQHRKSIAACLFCSSGIVEFGDVRVLEARVAEMEERVSQLEATIRLLARGN
jgi:hypothetical protein